MTTRKELYDAILADPEDVTLRLVYADCLDEQPKPRVKCPNCRGSKIEHQGRSGWINCPKCDGSGTVLDTSDADLAEFIRVQCEWEALKLVRQPNTPEGVEETKRVLALAERSDDLEACHPEWRRAECPGCNGRGMDRVETVNAGVVDRAPCPTCGGTGDLFVCEYKRIDLPDGVARQRNTPTARAVVFRNGFPNSLSCELREIGEEQVFQHGRGGCREFVPSAWAAAVVRAFPVTRFVLTDRKPDLPAECGWTWQNQPIPAVILADMYFDFRTAEAATDALALAAGRVVRRAVYGSEA